MRPSGEIRILATSFGRFPGVRVNPSAAIVDGLTRAAPQFQRFGRVRLFTGTIPVSWRQAEPMVRQLLDQARPDVVVLVGVAGRRKGLSVEARALNRRSILRADADKRTADARRIAPTGAFIRTVRAPVTRLVVAARRAGAPAGSSIDAGDYLCNQMLYSALAGDASRVVFVHMPHPNDPGIPRKRRDGRGRRANLATLTRGLAAIVFALAADFRGKSCALAEAARE